MRTVSEELERIRIANGGLIRAETVVEVAQDEDSPLHSYFCWDDTEAAHKYRLWQARDLIRVEVTVLEKTNKSIRAYVSLLDDRKNGDGYRSIVDVLNDPDQRSALLRQALRSFEYFEERYQVLKELTPLFTSAQKIRKKFGVTKDA